MNSINFCKFHAFGNDYIVVEKQHLTGIGSPPDFARTICNRHTGVGSDGIAVLEQLDGEEADYHCEIINPDGSVAGFSGNGTRCAVAYLFYRNLWAYPGLRLRTRSGIKIYTLIERLSEGHYWFDSEIGKPVFASDKIPVAAENAKDSVIDHDIFVAGERLKFSAVNVGNPVACVFVENFDLDWRSLGKEMESHDMFPQKANIVFVKIVDRENIELRIWERGAGETSASGTCSSGAAVLSAFTGRTARTVSVHTTGGTTEVHWRDDDEMVITGRADLVFCGEWSE